MKNTKIKAAFAAVTIACSGISMAADFKDGFCESGSKGSYLVHVQGESSDTFNNRVFVAITSPSQGWILEDSEGLNSLFTSALDNVGVSIPSDARIHIWDTDNTFRVDHPCNGDGFVY